MIVQENIGSEIGFTSDSATQLTFDPERTKSKLSIASASKLKLHADLTAPKELLSPQLPGKTSLTELPEAPETANLS